MSIEPIRRQLTPRHIMHERRSPDLTFVWGFVRSFSIDLRPKDLILIRLGFLIEVCRDDPDVNCNLFNPTALCSPDGGYHEWASIKCPAFCGLCPHGNASTMPSLNETQ